MITKNTNLITSVKGILTFLEIFSSQKSLLLLDIDDTLIKPEVYMGDIIDLLKEKGYKDLVSQWRLNRKVTLTDPSWPKVLLQLKKQDNIKVMALTHMDKGIYGSIPSLEKWRYNELKAMSLLFQEAQEEPIEFYGGSYYGGIYFTGNSNKKSILEKILSQTSYDALILVDDKISQLEAMKEAAIGMKVQALEYSHDGAYKDPGPFEKEFLAKILAREDMDEEIKALAKKKLEATKFSFIKIATESQNLSLDQNYLGKF
jgi:hypothetical protein